MKRKCPFCSKMVVDILRHIRITHDIENVEKYEQEIEKIAKNNTKQAAFQKFVEELQEMERKGIISTEDYRRKVTEWIKLNKA